MTANPYVLAVEIRRFAAVGGWSVEDLSARAQAEIEKRTLLADLPDPETALWDNYPAFYHPESDWRCDNCGVSRSEKPRLHIRTKSFYDAKRSLLLHLCDACPSPPHPRE